MLPRHPSLANLSFLFESEEVVSFPSRIFCCRRVRIELILLFSRSVLYDDVNAVMAIDAHPCGRNPRHSPRRSRKAGRKEIAKGFAVGVDDDLDGRNRRIT